MIGYVKKSAVKVRSSYQKRQPQARFLDKKSNSLSKITRIHQIFSNGILVANSDSIKDSNKINIERTIALPNQKSSQSFLVEVKASGAETIIHTTLYWFVWLRGDLLSAVGVGYKC